MARSVIALRGSEGEREAWERCAEASGLRLSAWLRRAANQTAEMEGALEKEVPVAVLAVPPTVEQVRDKMYPQKRKRCIHRLMPGTYCKQCQTTK